MNGLSKWTPTMLSILRIVTGFVFLFHGTQKLFGYPPGPQPSDTQMVLGGWLELVGGSLMLLGLGTRLVAFILSGEMAVAFFQFHFPKGGWNPVQNKGEPAVLYCFLFLFFVIAGAGPISLDWVIRGPKTAEPGAIA
jgi:putative oxidoreductase